MFVTACGTMPVPSMPQPTSVVAKSTVETSERSTSDSDNSVTTLNSTATGDAHASGHAESVTNTTQAAIAVENSDSEKPGLENETGSTPAVTSTGEDSIANSLPAVNTDVAVVSSRSKSAEDILQDPVISKTQPSQTVMAAVTAPIENYSATEQQSSATTNPAGTTIADITNTKTVNASTNSTLALANQPLLKSEPPTKSKEVPKFAVLTANDRVKNAIILLSNGDEQHAEKELADALVIEPNNRAARRLMRQLHESPADFFVEEDHFDYVVRLNETLFSVAEKFLEDPLDFYMLAKLNDIKYPNSLVSGKILTIPGVNRLNVDKASKPPPVASLEASHTMQAPVKNEDDIKIERAKVYFAEHRYQEVVDLLTPYADKKSASKYAPLRDLLAQSYLELANDKIKKGDLLEAQAILETSMEALPGNKPLKSQLTQVRNTRESERLYRLGVQESQTGKQDQALKSFAKALQFNPANEQAKKQITDLRLTVVEKYHKQAMVLYRKQELSKAIEIWDNILQIDPDYELAKQYRSRALELKRKIEQL